jgi:hypothetical protein
MSLVRSTALVWAAALLLCGCSGEDSPASSGGAAAPVCHDQVFEESAFPTVTCDPTARIELVDGYFYCRCEPAPTAAPPP